MTPKATTRPNKNVNLRDPDGTLRRTLEYIAGQMTREFGKPQTMTDAAYYAARHMADVYRQMEAERKVRGSG